MSETPADNLCDFLEWDSSFFGLHIARLNIDRLTTETLKSALTWCDSNDIDCLYFLGDAGDQQTDRIAEDNHFQFVDIRITLERKLHNVPAARPDSFPQVIRPATPDDIPVLQDIARASHRDSRFYYDSNFPKESCDALYQNWIAKSCNGYADVVFVAEAQGKPVGYISCKLLDRDKGQIGLVGVSAEARGKGFGQTLVNEALRWFASREANLVLVVTQGRNYKAQRLYQQNGFLTQTVQLWYHKWFPRTDPKPVRSI